MRRTQLFNALAVATFLAVTLAPTDAAARITKGPWVQKLTPTSAIIRVELDPPAPVSLEVGPGARDGGAQRTIEDKETRALHSLVVTGLEPATRYPYTVRAGSEAANGSLTTAPREPSTEPYKFLIYGDNRTDDTAHGAIVKAMAATPTDFVVHTGDFVADGGSAEDWQTFFDIEAPLLRERCVFACVGNHELTDGSGLAFARYFGPGEPPPSGAAGSARGALEAKHFDGTFRWGNARFFMINAMVPYRSGADRTWLERVLAESDAETGLRWRIVVLHHGLWSSGPHGDNLFLHEANIPQVLRSHKVDLVISGHDHLYERGAVDGLSYVVSGGGGAPTYKVRAPKPHAKKLESVRHFVEASVNEEAIALRVVRIDGSVLEKCGLHKGQGWDCDGVKPPPELAPGSSAPAGAAGAGGSAKPSSSSCACRAVALPEPTPGPGGRGAGVAMLLAVSAWLARRRR
jgi:acid phosphatase type 7